MSRKVDYKTALRTLKRAIKAKGEDFITEGCLYSNQDGSACCIVGNALSILDLPRPDFIGFMNGQLFSKYNFNYEDTKGILNEKKEPLLVDWLKERDVEFTPKAAKLYGLVQYYQDEHIPWGESLLRALEDLEKEEFDGRQ